MVNNSIGEQFTIIIVMYKFSQLYIKFYSFSPLELHVKLNPTMAYLYIVIKRWWIHISWLSVENYIKTIKYVIAYKFYFIWNLWTNISHKLYCFI
jgi:hypothetical protein